VVIQRQLDSLTRAKAAQAGAFHVPGDRPSRLVIVNQECQTELGQNFMRNCCHEDRFIWDGDMDFSTRRRC
jgi:hypothetical protein